MRNSTIISGLVSLIMACSPAMSPSRSNQDAEIVEIADSADVDAGNFDTGIPLDAGLPGYPSAHGYPNGTIVLYGGGIDGLLVFRDAIDSTGNNWDVPVVFCPTAWPNPDGADDLNDSQLQSAESMIRIYGFTNVTVLHTRDPNVANSEDFVAPLRTAYGVWFGGGRQYRLADAYLGTRTLDELRKVLDRGGVVGGTSAGASIMSSFLIRGQTGEDNQIVIGDHTEGFGFLQNVGIDQHVKERGRQDDLKGFVTQYPDHLGIGLDERTAAVFNNNVMRITGQGMVHIIYLSFLDENSNFSLLLNPGQSYDISTLQINP